MDTRHPSPRNLSKFCQMALSRQLARCLPFPVSQQFVACLGRLYYWQHPRERELICQTIEKVFGDLPPRALRRLYRRTFQGIYRHYQEKLFLAYAAQETVRGFLTRRLAVAGSGELDAALAGGRGVILVTGHFGAVEFLPAALGLRGYPAAVIVRPQTRELAESMAQRAALINLELIIPADGRVLPAALRALRQGRVLITEMDEFEMWRGRPREMVDFLGFTLPGDRTLEVLQQRAGAPVLTALVHRRPGRRYTVVVQPPAPPRPGLDMGGRCLQRLEEAIRQAPEQWYQWKEFGKAVAGLPVPPFPDATAELVLPRPQVGKYVPA